MSDFKPINPGQTSNIGSRDHLNQTQHKGNRVDIVDHFDKGPKAVNCHIITTIDGKGNIKTNY